MIQELPEQLLAAWHESSWTEMAAAALGVVYLVLAIGRRLSCWAAAFVSSILYVWVFFEARLYMGGVLSIFYAIMAVYGYRQWLRGEGEELPITRWPLLRHLTALGIIMLLSSLSFLLLRRYTVAALPFFDSLELWASMWTTFLVARKVYENWHWWLLIDSLGVGLYFSRHLYATTLLFILYVVLIVIGWREWRRVLPAVHAAA